MKYEKYLISEEYHIDEAMSPTKALNKLRNKIETAGSTQEVRLAGSMLVKFIRKFGKDMVWTDATSKEITDLMAKAKERVK